MIKKTLRDAPSGQAFINSCIAAVADMALAFSGEADDRVLERLEEGRDSLTERLAAEVGADLAAAIVDAMIRATMGHKHQIGSNMVGHA